jgi:hypothetical protein
MYTRKLFDGYRMAVSYVCAYAGATDESRA